MSAMLSFPMNLEKNETTKGTVKKGKNLQEYSVIIEDLMGNLSLSYIIKQCNNNIKKC